MTRHSNGQAIVPALSIEFDLDNPAQARAWEVANRLAANYGVRKSLLVAFFNALADFKELTGRDMTTEMVSGLFMARAMTGIGGREIVGGPPPSTLPDDEIIATSSQKKTAVETAKQFTGKMGNLFG